MACRIADNAPLSSLAIDIGAPSTCHSLRAGCLHGLPQSGRDIAMGVRGAAIGYCQALFPRVGTPAAHTRRVAHLLAEAGAPWSLSHELYWGYRGGESAATYLQEATKPLIGSGRIPIVITALDPDGGRREIRQILASDIRLSQGETALVRLQLSSDASIAAAAELIVELATVARQKGCLPPWWPLLQGSLTISQWSAFRNAIGSDWQYVNIAVNPFVGADVVGFLGQQVTVAQLPVGLAEGVDDDGTVKLPEDMRISGAPATRSYNVLDFATSLKSCDLSPTVILLGPALSGWSDSMCVARINALLPHLRAACEVLWRDVAEAGRQELWTMAA